jgi:hypothetical protein
MNRIALAAILAVVTVVPAIAGDNTAVGVGTGIANSSSASSSKATAISGQGGTGVGVGTGGNPSATVNVAGTPAVQTINQTGTSTIRNVPSVFSPGLAAAGLETCLGSVSGGGSFVGTGLSFGTTVPDAGCAARLDARTLWSMGLRKAAIQRLCLNPDIYRSMPEVCGSYVPQVAPVGYGYPPPPLAGPPLSTFGSAEPTGRHVPVMLVDGRNQREHLCNDYDAAAQHCVRWAGERSVKVVTAHVTSSKPKPVPARLKIDPPPADGAKAASVQ